jgi:nitroimidazol reductase NimA-like FMN-containing flavoprotein (pyridoxamine 5'-phosphate oxidase superfamily)
MTSVETLPQGDLRLLEHPIAQELLQSAIPARVGYIATDGTPRVTPMWFTWNGTELVFGAAGNSPKVNALESRPQIAVTIDTSISPYRILTIRGRADIETLEGAVVEYAEAALRYMGPTHGAQFRDYTMNTMTNMARITLKPDWVSLIDFQTRYPSSY